MRSLSTFALASNVLLSKIPIFEENKMKKNELKASVTNHGQKKFSQQEIFSTKVYCKRENEISLRKNDAF